MKLLLVLLVMVPVSGAGVSACGGASNGSSSVSRASGVVASTSGSTRTGGYLRGDKDNDGDEYDDSDDYLVLKYGHAVDPVDEKAVTMLARRYLAAAARSDGSAACPLLYAGIDKGAKLLKAIPLPYTPGLNSPMRGKSCAVVMSRLFREDGEQLGSEIGSLQVIGLRVGGWHALVLLGFRTTGERDIAMIREGGAWKIDALLDSPLP